MEYDFIYDRDSRRYRLKLATEQAALQQFLLDEFAHRASAYQPLLNQLKALKPYQDWQYQGREFSLLVQQQEVRVPIGLRHPKPLGKAQHQSSSSSACSASSAPTCWCTAAAWKAARMC